MIAVRVACRVRSVRWATFNVLSFVMCGRWSTCWCAYCRAPWTGCRTSKTWSRCSRRPTRSCTPTWSASPGKMPSTSPSTSTSSRPSSRRRWHEHSNSFIIPCARCLTICRLSCLSYFLSSDCLTVCTEETSGSITSHKQLCVMLLFCQCTQDCTGFHTWTLTGSGGSSVVRAPDSWSKGRGFESLLGRRENFLLQGQLSVLTLISVPVPPRSTTVLPQ